MNVIIAKIITIINIKKETPMQQNRSPMPTASTKPTSNDGKTYGSNTSERHKESLSSGENNAANCKP